MRNWIFIGLLILGPKTIAQEIPLGTWRTHFSYARVNLAEETPNFIFAAADVGLFSVEKSSREVQKFSTLDGLQGVDISALAYDQSTQSLYIGYRSGNLDIIAPEGIVNIDLVATSQIVGPKAVNAISFAAGRAFIATAYGILDFDSRELEVKGTYRELGVNAAQLGVRDVLLFGDSLFATTEEGWQAAAVTGASLADYRNWQRYQVPQGIDHLTSFDNGVYFQSEDTIYTYRNGQFGVLPGTGAFRGIDATAETLVIYTADSIRLTDRNGTVIGVVVSDAFNLINDVLADETGAFWVADGRAGLLADVGSDWASFSPTGPERSDMFSLAYSEGNMLAFTGGYSAALSPFGRAGSYSVFSQGRWSNIRETDFDDISDGLIVEGETFLASAGDGILQSGTDGTIIFNEENSPLTADNTGQVLVTDLNAVENTLYAVNHNSPAPLLRFNGSEWESISGIPPIGRYAVEVEPVRQVAWLRILRSRGGGVLGYNLQSGTSRYITEQPDEGNLASRTVYDLEVDRDGFLWFGTDRGVSILFNPNVLDGPINAVEPVFDGRPLLVDREVYVVETDGGNRKWMGTDQGAWLFDALADELIVHFTVENSPLPSDVILDIAINDETGEVFFLTDAGIASYRAAATAADRVHADVKIYPNPVRREFQGTVGISGLARDAIVRITDVSGRLIYQTRANGGTAAWPVRQMNRLNTGMYLVFSASEDGEESYVGKIAVIN